MGNQNPKCTDIRRKKPIQKQCTKQPITEEALRDWHTVPDTYLSIALLAIMITGLLFTKIANKTYPFEGRSDDINFPHHDSNDAFSFTTEISEAFAPRWLAWLTIALEVFTHRRHQPDFHRYNRFHCE